MTHGKRPEGQVKIVYKSTRYTLFSYLKMVERPVDLEELKDIFGKMFRSRGVRSEIRTVMNRSVKENLVKSVDHDTWMITDFGKKEIYGIVERFRKHRMRVLGKDYMDQAMAKMHSASCLGFPLSMDERDIEDEVLDKMDRDFTRVVSARSKKRKENASGVSVRDSKAGKPSRPRSK